MIKRLERRQRPAPSRGRTRSALADAVVSEPLRRAVYLAAIAFGLPVLVIVWILHLRQQTFDPFILYGHPFLFLMCLWATAWLLRGKSLRVAERVVFVCNALAVQMQAIMAMLVPEAPVMDLTSGAYWMLLALAILSFLLFETRQAGLLTAMNYTLSVALPWGALLARGESLLAYPELLRVQLTSGAILVLLYCLAWYRTRFMLERGERMTLERLAQTDPLTTLPNRRALYPAIEDLLQRPSPDVPGSVILLDLDHFKRINDTYGHNVGDDVLIRTAELLRQNLRETDTVGRWGGEEFLIALPDTDQIGALTVAQRLLHILRTTPQARIGPVTASLGVAVCEEGDTLALVTARVDAALYSAKQAGRDRFILASGRSRLGGYDLAPDLHAPASAVGQSG